MGWNCWWGNLIDVHSLAPTYIRMPSSIIPPREDHSLNVCLKRPQRIPQVKTNMPVIKEDAMPPQEPITCDQYASLGRASIFPHHQTSHSDIFSSFDPQIAGDSSECSFVRSSTDSITESKCRPEIFMRRPVDAAIA